MTVTETEYQAIKNNDTCYDNIFCYAVKSTKIFCRPSCLSRLPKKENIEIYYMKEEAVHDGYRPCKRCQPLGESVSDEEWVKEIDTILQRNYQQKLTLEELSYLARGSESNLRHTYKAVTGMTPQKRLMNIRLEKASEELLETNLTVKEIAEEVGIGNVGYFIRKFREYYDDSPLQFRLKNKDPLK
ncbi:bifunctional transcriptional activator/DNA repair enzyme AdaA [Tetragenococcus muriaticus]|uniref:Methylphosphotriester-DNA alkyltransferase n=1 Tax=Tetragenococcus muriaticus 3MR10-3 TaxID=1302648 RepID=A0A091C3S4_9ENTE|nr:Ada metal-binding domain-containing protein [Tetragenococcus muriaticus]KFN91569.1 methylphosphotriester-DNA alkyltransferase [Tetragenococcus muriaticus 3MR10-3]GMA46645.1 methylphosphotriester-DNA alkyltransferase [Tetragenococcus muriaticus]